MRYQLVKIKQTDSGKKYKLKKNNKYFTKIKNK